MKFILSLISFLFFIGNVAAASEPLYSQFVEQVYLTEEAALKIVFPDSNQIKKEEHIFTVQEKKKIESRLGWTLSVSSIVIHHGFKGSEPQGYAVVMNEMGKFKPITFMVKVSEQGKVERIEVLTYRETVGAEVRRQRFSRQFQGKSARDPMRINRDIINLTGATLSVQAMTAGVKKALVILDELYFNLSH